MLFIYIYILYVYIMHVYRDLNLSGSDSVKVCIAKSRCKVCKESIPKIKCFHSCVHIVPVIVHRQEKFREHIGCMGLALSCPVANKKNIIKSNNQVQHLLNFSTQKVKDKTTCSTPGLQSQALKQIQIVMQDQPLVVVFFWFQPKPRS